MLTTFTGTSCFTQVDVDTEEVVEVDAVSMLLLLLVPHEALSLLTSALSWDEVVVNIVLAISSLRVVVTIFNVVFSTFVTIFCRSPMTTTPLLLLLT